MINLEYQNLLTHIDKFLVPGRYESASFLMWYLENYYRLDTQQAIESVCDQMGDKGIDGIYVNEALGTIDVFQTKISQNSSRTTGDVVLKEFYGTLSQFKSKESIQNLISTASSKQLLGLIERLAIINKIDSYKIRGVFVTNIETDNNGNAFLSECPDIEFIGKNILESTFISSSREIPQNTNAQFDISGVNISEYYADADTITYIAPIRAIELVQMDGIADQSIFDYNVRGPLGNTNVNKGIVSSIKNPALHKKFPLFHNGITIVANGASCENDKLNISTFFVVNGCQSLTALFKNRQHLTNELRILTKIIKVPVNSDLSSQITEFSNSQNGVKPRDFKSYNPIQVRLQNEFNQNFRGEYYFEVKRGEQAPNGSQVISNEDAGILIMTFDLKEPWATHRKYQVFEDLYNEIFARPEVTADRILMLKLIDNCIIDKMQTINNQLIARYTLTRYAILYIVRSILDHDIVGVDVINNPTKYVRNSQSRQNFISCINYIIDAIIIDFNLEVDGLGEDFDYKSKLRDEHWVKDLAKNIISIYLKLVKSNRQKSFENEWMSNQKRTS